MLMSSSQGAHINALLPNLFFILSFAVSFLMVLFVKESFKAHNTLIMPQDQERGL